jgi:two-component system, NtrC family, sensor kinase
MINLRTIIYSSGLDKYDEFVQICKLYYKNIVYINNSVEFLREVLNLKDTITIIFIEKDMANKISESLSVLLKNENYLCVLFSKDNSSDNQYRDYINDYLQCFNKVVIENFIKRLNRNLYYRIKLFNNNIMLNKFYDIAKQLAAEKDINKLLDLITDYSMEITSCDAASLYIIIDKETEQYSFYEKNINDKLLKFMIAKNNSIDIKLQAATIEISPDSIIGASVISGMPIRINDAYNIPDNEGYRFNKGFDEKTGYKTQSVIAIPMKDHEDRVLGVIQLINKKEFEVVVPFSPSDESVIYSLAGQAAVVLENNLLYSNLNSLLEKNRDTIKEEINKRKSADEEINKLLSAIENSPVSVFITDVEGRIEYVNPELEKLTGYTFLEITHKNPRIFKSGKQGKDYYKDLWDIVLQGGKWQGELINKKKNGELYWVNSSIAPVKDSNGKIKYFIVVQEDVTEKKKLSLELQEKNNHLEETIKQLHISQAQLIQNEKLAGIGELAAGVAHEINTPLGFVISNLNSLKKYFIKMNDLLLLYKNISNNVSNSKNDDRLKAIHDYEKENNVSFILDDISAVLKESKEGLLKVSDIIKALRSFSGIDSFDMVQMYDINNGINNTLIMLQNEITDCIKVHKNLGNIPMISVYDKEVNQVFLNLIKNAVYAIKCKFSTEYKGVINVKTYFNNNHIFIEIEDNGIGIEEKHMNKIFDPFFTTKPVGEGTGLGLSTSYDIIVNKLGGIISVNSTPGSGTVFTIKLPQ